MLSISSQVYGPPLIWNKDIEVRAAFNAISINEQWLSEICPHFIRDATENKTAFYVTF